MSDRVYAPGWDNPAIRRADRGWATTRSSVQLAIDSLWVIFFIGASSAFSIARIIDIRNTERFVWFPADVFVLVFLYMRQKECLYLIRKNALFVSWALIACVSSVWSQASGTSLNHGVQLFFTIMVGFMLISYADLQRVQKIIFTALLLCALASIAVTVVLPQYAFSLAGGWLGVFPHKNVFGGMMLILMLTAICLFLQGWRSLLSLGGIVVSATLLALSLSAASLVMAAAALSAFLFAVGFRKGIVQFIVCVGIAVVIAALGFMWLEAIDSDVSEVFLSGLGKDQTLTGRTVIWDMAMDAYESRPWLGFGFKGFWEGGGTGAAYLRFFIGQDIWHFHNNFIEVAVAFGFFGPVILAVSLLVGFIRVVRAFVIEPEFVRIWPILIIIIIFIACFAEVPLFINHSIYQVLFILAVGSVFQESGIHQSSDER